MTNAAYQLNNDAVISPPPPLPPHTPLRGRYISLLPLQQAAAEYGKKLWAELFSVSHGDAARESVWDYMPYGPFADAASLAECYAGMSGDTQFYVVMHTADKAAARAGGIVSYLRMQSVAYSVEIGHIWHAPDCQRGRANTEAVFLLADYIFDLGYRRLEWKCNALNMRSRWAALRLGLAFEGIFRQCTVYKGKNRDTAWFALLDGDWAAAKRNMQTWLDSPLGDSSLGKSNLPLVEWSLAAHDGWASGG